MKSSPSLAVLGKLSLGVAVFALITGGYVAAQLRRAALAPLPDLVTAQGGCPIWFVGSSSIFRWRSMQADMAPWQTHNRGIGGALLPSLTRALGNEPKQSRAPVAFVFYAGDNDIAKGATAEQTLSDFRAFLAVKDERFARVPMLVLSIKPSPTRQALFPVQNRYDRELKALSDARGDLAFVDVTSPMLVNGRPGPFFVEDGIHLDDAGYRIWTREVHAGLRALLPARTLARCTRASALPAQAA